MLIVTDNHGQPSGRKETVVRSLWEADALLKRLDQLHDPEHAGSAACGRRLEQEADKLPARQRDLVKWFCEQALSRFKKAEAGDEANLVTW